MSSQTRSQEVLLVSDAPDLDLKALTVEFQTLSLQPSRVEDVSQARRYLQLQGLPVLLIVDLYSETAERIKFCQDLLKRAGPPLIVISSTRDTTEEALSALSCADSYLRRQETQPSELRARVNSILKRFRDFSYGSGLDIHLFDGLSVNFTDRTITAQGRLAQLTPTESAILFVLLTHRGESVEASVLQERVWSRAPDSQRLNALRVHVHRLRHKIEQDPDHPQVLLTGRGTGYTLTMP